MKKILGTLFLFLASSGLKGLTNPAAQIEVARLKWSLMYVRSIKTFRLLFLSMLSMGVCLVFLLTALVLLHVSLFLYAPWSAATKFLVGLICSGIYLALTLGIFYQIFASDKWLKIFNADTIMDQLKKASREGSQEAPSEEQVSAEASPQEAHSLN